MQDFGFYIKREPSYEPSRGSIVTDLPSKEPQKAPRDLPSPRHRPGEPIMYDPPPEKRDGVYEPDTDPTAPNEIR